MSECASYGDFSRRGLGQLLLSTRGKIAAFIALALFLGGCGVTYTSPSVNTKDEDVPVTVIPLNVQSVQAANKSKYSPRGLPEVFFGTAGSGSLRGAGALPAAPLTAKQRRETIVARIPENIEPTPYQIGIGDVLLLATRGGTDTLEQLSGLLAAQNQRQGYTVRDDGAIAIPQIGTVQLAGMTLQEAEDAMFRRLVESQIDPSFSIEVAEFNSKRVAVGGAVKNTSLLPITLNPLSLGEALTAAGGFSVKDEEFSVIRIYRDGALYQIPVETYLSDSKLRDLLLQNGDAVYVDTTYDLDRAFEYYKQQIDVISLRANARGIALNALNSEIGLQRSALQERRDIFLARNELDAVERDYVYLTGEVQNQARVALPFGRQATLADVLYDEGGFDNTTGDPSQIYILRAQKSSGQVTAFHLDTENAANIVLATQMEMRPNDVVFIEEQPITKWGRALQQLFPVLLSTAGGAI